MTNRLFSLQLRQLILIVIAFVLSACAVPETPESQQVTRVTGIDKAIPQTSPFPIKVTSELAATPLRIESDKPEAEIAASPTILPELSNESLDSQIIEIDKINPLTGLVVEDPAVLQRRPLAVKVSNINRVRPQSGLNKADIIFEHITEGGITRFTAIFYTNDAGKVGSIRSARLIDLEIPLMFDAAFAYSGSSYPIKMMVSDSSFFERVVSPDFGHSGFYRNFDSGNPPRFLEDTMFTDTYTIRSALQERGVDVPPRLPTAFQFQEELPEGGEPIKSLEVRYNATIAFWNYDTGLDTFLRWSDGSRHIDATTGQQLAFENIVVIQANHLNTEIIEDSLGSPSIQIQLWGEGPVSIFRNGQRFDGIWRREQPDRMPTFFTEDGSAIPLSPGKTFFQIVPSDNPRFSVEY